MVTIHHSAGISPHASDLISDLPQLSSLDPDRLFPRPVEPTCEASVVIPARNEEDTLRSTLESLARQQQLDGASLPSGRFEVLLLINNTIDRSAEIARRVAGANPSLHLHIAEIDLPEPLAHVGQARRLLMDAACERMRRSNRPRGVIATTDADTVVSPTWVSATLDAVNNGADAVGGRIIVAEEELRTMDPDARTWHLRDVGYRYLLSQLEAVVDPPPGDPWPRHFQHFGASLAVTADMYQRAGGLPVRRSLEDVAFYARLQEIDAIVRHSPDVRVYTSARRSGRTEFGFAVQLRKWGEMHRCGTAFLVRSPEDLLEELQTRRVLRNVWGGGKLEHPDEQPALQRLANDLSMSLRDLLAWLQRAGSFGRLWGQLRKEVLTVETRLERFPLVEIDQAIRDLRVLVSRLNPVQVLPSATLEHVEPVELLPAVRQMA